jgi:hypothetical protein
LAAAALLFVAAWWFQGYMDNLPTDSGQQMLSSTQDVIAEFVHVLYCSVALLGLLAAYWLRLGRIIARAAQYPLPQMRLFHDMRILRGEAKRKYARRLRISAVLALVFAAVLLGAALVLPRNIAREHPILFQQGAPAPGSAGHAA